MSLPGMPPMPPQETADERKARQKQEEQNRQNERLAWAQHQSRVFATFKREGWTASSEDKDKYSNSDRSNPNFMGAMVAEGVTFFEKGKIYDHEDITAKKGFGILYDEDGSVRAVPPIHELSPYGIRGIVTHPEKFKQAIDAEVDFISGGLGFDTIKADYPAVTEVTKTHFLKKFDLTLESCRGRGLRFNMPENGPFMQSLSKDERLKLQQAIHDVNKHAQAMELQRNSTNDKLYDKDARTLNQEVNVPLDPANPQTYPKDKAYRDAGADGILAANAPDMDATMELADKKMKVIDTELQNLDKFLAKVTNASDALKSELDSKVQLLAEPEEAVAKRVKYLESSKQQKKYDKMSDTEKNLEKIDTKERIIDNVEKANNIIDGKRKIMIRQLGDKIHKLERMQVTWKDELERLKRELDTAKANQLALADDRNTSAADKTKADERVKKLEAQIKENERLDKKATDAGTKLTAQKAQLQKSIDASHDMTNKIQQAKEKQAEHKASIKNS